MVRYLSRRLTHWVATVDSALVADRPRARRAHLRMMVLLPLLVFAAVRLGDYSTIPGTVASLTVAGMTGRAALAVVNRMQAYRNGWLDGRVAMLHSLGEAMKRGWTADEWATAEWERDAVVLGVAPHPGSPGDSPGVAPED